MAEKTDADNGRGDGGRGASATVTQSAGSTIFVRDVINGYLFDLLETLQALLRLIDLRERYTSTAVSGVRFRFGSFQAIRTASSKVPFSVL